MKLRADRRVGLLLVGVMFSTFVALGATVALPGTDESLDVENAELSDEAAYGRDVYLRQALWQCNAGYVRESATDGTLLRAEATSPEDVAGVNPVMLGIERVGRFPIGAEELARDCGVKLPQKELDAVDSFLATRWAP